MRWQSIHSSVGSQIDRGLIFLSRSESTVIDTYIILLSQERQGFENHKGTTLTKFFFFGVANPFLPFPGFPTKLTGNQ